MFHNYRTLFMSVTFQCRCNIQGDTKTFINKNWITDRIIFLRFSQNLCYIKLSLCRTRRHLQSFNSLTGAQKMCSKWATQSYPVLQADMDLSNKVLDDPHTFFPWDYFYCCLQIRDSGGRGVVVIHPALKVSLQIKNLGRSSPVNAATTPGHTCGWSVCQGNSAVAIPMIRLRCGDGTILPEPLEAHEDPSSSTKCWAYRSVLIITDCSLSSSHQYGPMMPCLEMAIYAVH